MQSRREVTQKRFLISMFRYFELAFSRDVIRSLVFADLCTLMVVMFPISCLDPRCGEVVRTCGDSQSVEDSKHPRRIAVASCFFLPRFTQHESGPGGNLGLDAGYSVFLWPIAVVRERPASLLEELQASPSR